MPEHEDEHYLRAVTELGDTRKIVAGCDIHSQSGIKLVASGVCIKSGLYERLVKHKLLPSLDKALSIENMLDPGGILDDVRELLESNGKLRAISDLIDRNFFERLILDAQIPAPLAFKLTVAREKYPEIYQHSLLLMVTGIYLAGCDGMSAREQMHVLMAALFHDIGLLHIDPRLLAPAHVMNDAERRHLYTHPLTGYLLLCEFPEIAGDIANAVLEHHERMDGGGYPRGLSGDRISRAGQILAIAELVAKAFDSDQPQVPWKKLEVMLKLNSKQYGQGLIGHLTVFREDNADGTAAGNGDPAHLIALVTLIAELFDNFSQHAPPARRDKIFDLAATRLAALRLELLEAGFDPYNPAEMTQRFMDEPECRSDYVPLLNEALWQFKSLVVEISRLWPKELEELESQAGTSERTWLNNMKRSLLSADMKQSG